MFAIICRCCAYKIHDSMSKAKVTLRGQRWFLPFQWYITSQIIVIYSWYLVSIITIIICRCVPYKTRNFMSNVKVTGSKRLYKCFDILAWHVALGQLVLPWGQRSSQMNNGMWHSSNGDAHTYQVSLTYLERQKIWPRQDFIFIWPFGQKSISNETWWTWHTI